MDPEPSSRLWKTARVVLLASLVPLIIAIALLAIPISNPGVQDCGSPAIFAVSDRSNDRVAVVGVETTPEQRTLAAQSRCSTRVRDRLILAGVAGAMFLVFAAAGAVLGLIDDRHRLHHEPPIEDYLRDPDRDPAA